MSDPTHYGGMSSGFGSIHVYSKERNYEILVTNVRQLDYPVISPQETEQIVKELNGSISISNVTVSGNTVRFESAPNNMSVAEWARDSVMRILQKRP
jgi:hypothetical protein